MRPSDNRVQDIEHSLHEKLPRGETGYDKLYSPITYILFFFTFAIFGWVWEVAFTFVMYGMLVNRGTMFGPWVPIYGVGTLLVLLVLRKAFDRPVLTFFMSMIMTSSLEYATGWYLETFRGMRWWNYSGYFMNLHGRICLSSAVAFGIGCCAVIYVVAPLLDNLFSKISKKIKIIICIVLIACFAFDFVYSTINPHTGSGVTSKLVITQTVLD